MQQSTKPNQIMPKNTCKLTIFHFEDL